MTNRHSRTPLMNLSVGMGVGISALIAVTLQANAVFAQQWVDKNFMSKRGAKFINRGEEVTDKIQFHVFTVEKVEGDLLWTGEAWIKKEEVIELGKAAAYFSDLVKKDPMEAVNYERRGYAFYWQGDSDKAIQDYDRAIQLDPRMAIAYQNRGVARYFKFEYDKAIENFAEAIRLDARLATAHEFRGLSRAAIGDFANAIEDFDQLIRLRPNNAEALRTRGKAWLFKGDKENSIRDYTAAIRLAPGDVSGYENRGRIWDFYGEYEKAIEDFSEMIRLAPANGNGLVFRAMSFENRGDHEKAINDLQEASKIQEPNAVSYNLLAWILATCPDEKLRDGKRAVALATKACALEEFKNSGPIDTLAACFAEVDDFEKAVMYQNKAIELNADPNLVKEITARLELYQKGQPFRQAK